MTNEELVQKIQSGIDVKDSMSELYLKNKPMIKLIADRMNCPDQTEDLLQEAYFGLARAAELYDPDRGSQFVGYMVYWVKQSMLRYLYRRDTVKLPEYLKTTAVKYQKIIADFKKEKGNAPSDALLRSLLEVKQPELELIRRSLFSYNVRSLDEYISDEEDFTLGESIPDPDSQIDELIESEAQKQEADVLWNTVDLIAPESAQILRSFYQEGKSLPEVAKALNKPSGKVHSDHWKAIRKLRNPVVMRKLRSCAELYGIGVRSVSLETFEKTRMSSTEIAAFRDMGIECSLNG